MSDLLVTVKQSDKHKIRTKMVNLWGKKSVKVKEFFADIFQQGALISCQDLTVALCQCRFHTDSRRAR